MPIRVKCGDVVFSPELLSRDTFVSLSTGATLQRLSVELTAGSTQAKTLVNAIVAESRPIHTLDEQGNAVTMWKARQVRESYSDNNPTHTYVWELTEQETVALTELILSDLVVIPYEYKEQFDDNGLLTIDARARLNAGEVKRLGDLPHFFPVVRKGISDTAREMRFGRMMWSDHGEYLKHAVYLVERDPSDKKLSGLLQPELWTMQTGIAITSCLMKNLLEILELKGVLDEEAIKGLRQRADAEVADRMRQFTQVDDLDQWE